MPLRRIAVLGGSSEASASADALRRLLAERGIVTIDTVLTAPTDCTDHSQVDGFVVLPGMAQSLQEVLNLCLGSANAREKPCGLLNVADYFSRLLEHSDDELLERFARETQRGRLVVTADPSALVEAMVEYRPPETRRKAV